MLKRLTLVDWKSFGTSGNELRFSPLTVMVGPNASGKSNVFDALRFLQGIALDLPVEDVLRGRAEGGREVWPGIRGGAAEASRKPTSRFSLESEWDSLTHSIEISTSPTPAVEHESLSEPGDNPLLSSRQPSLGNTGGRSEGGVLAVAVRRAKGTGRWPRKLYRDSASVLSQYRAETDVAPEVATQVALLRSMFRGLFFLDIQPRLMRGPSQLGRTLGLNGEHIAAAVHALTPSQRADVVDWLAELCAPKVTDLKTEFVSQVQEVYLLLEEQGSARISARSLSDGTLRFLGTLVALLTAPPGAVVLLEEPDVGLHPARIHLLAEFLESVTASRQIQVIATSHSPVLLAHLSDNAFGNVLAFDREPQGPTVVRQVRNLPNVGEVMKPEHRARLIATGWLERAA